MSIGFDERYAGSVWRRWREDRTSVPAEWANTFELLSAIYGSSFFPDAPMRQITPDQGFDGPVQYLRRYGHLHADLDPLKRMDLHPLPPEVAAHPLASAYTGAIAVETGHIDDPAMVCWIERTFEDMQLQRPAPDPEILKQLIETEGFDTFLSQKYPTKKRFGSEGADSILPMLHGLRDECRRGGTDEIVMGSMHRGRLSVLANFAGMSVSWLLELLTGRHPFPDRQDLPADVPYHFGHVGASGGVQLTLLPNPSHLETINSVTAGFARARQLAGSGTALPVIMHTDASVVAQGLSSELMQLSALPGFKVGGTIHIVINNQVGFTTDPAEARTSLYCTGPWRAVDSLILHVNGDDPDACVSAVRMAYRFRQKFRRDAIVDLVCYRRNGHNEIDEPRFTQPTYYRAADAKKALSEAYEARLIGAGKMRAGEADAWREQVRETLNRAFGAPPLPASPYYEASPKKRPAISRNVDELRRIAQLASDVHAERSVPKMKRLMDRRVATMDEGVDWALAEAMAVGSVLNAGLSVRLCGQDVERGSFSQRHLAAVDPMTGQRSHPLASLARGTARVEIVNSPLSEYAVLGFEYGHSLAAQDCLCIWEAQFGDFLNGAQIIVDQIISSGFEKWRQTSGLVVLLPHGLEGQGPEHSSGRIERMLHLCANDNIVVVHPSTPANYYHLLQSQATANDRPLFIYTPKKLLRLPAAKSDLSEFAGTGGFRPVIVGGRPTADRRVVICSGKIAYELEAQAEQAGVAVQVIRLEQFYPFPAQELVEAVRETKALTMVWLQEEPENYGAAQWLAQRLAGVADATGTTLLPPVTRPESASPAGSFHANHDHDQQQLLLRALELESSQDNWTSAHG